MEERDFSLDLGLNLVDKSERKRGNDREIFTIIISRYFLEGDF